MCVHHVMSFFGAFKWLSRCQVTAFLWIMHTGVASVWGTVCIGKNLKMYHHKFGWYIFRLWHIWKTTEVLVTLMMSQHLQFFLCEWKRLMTHLWHWCVDFNLCSKHPNSNCFKLLPWSVPTVYCQIHQVHLLWCVGQMLSVHMRIFVKTPMTTGKIPQGSKYWNLTKVLCDIPADTQRVFVYQNVIKSAAVFSHLSLCYTIFLSGNQISHIEIGAFVWLKSTTFLNLGGNWPSTLKTGMFMGMNNMQRLHLAQQNIYDWRRHISIFFFIQEICLFYTDLPLWVPIFCFTFLNAHWICRLMVKVVPPTGWFVNLCASWKMRIFTTPPDCGMAVIPGAQMMNNGVLFSVGTRVGVGWKDLWVRKCLHVCKSCYHSDHVCIWAVVKLPAPEIGPHLRSLLGRNMLAPALPGVGFFFSIEVRRKFKK